MNRIRTLRRLCVPLVAGVLLASALCVLLPAGPAHAVTAVGNDISWPQCGGTFPSGQNFGIVGVTGGLSDDVNPCLGPSPSYNESELYWAVSSSSGTSSQPKASLYINSADPGDLSGGTLVPDWPSEGTAPPYGSCDAVTVTTNSGPATAGDNSNACAWLYGAQVANQDVVWLGSAAAAIDGQSPPVNVSGAANAYPWWLDVETGNSWQQGAAGQSMNVALLQGMVSALSAAGAASIGAYSTSYQWGEITGGGAPGDLSGIATWIPGATDENSAEANCTDSSFTGGPVLLTQWTTTYDNDVACGSQGVGPTPNQIYGDDAIATSIAISQQEFSPGSAGAVVLARSDFFSDALAGGPLAAAKNGPLLITPGGPQGSLDPRVLAEIQRVLPVGNTVYILGGVLALPSSIDATLSGLGYNVVREAGVDEYATAADIAGALGNPSTVFLATGLSFYDALSAVPAAIVKGAAILLTEGSSQAPETETYLAEHAGDTVYAMGGPLAAAGADPSAIAIYGQDLFGTSAAIAGTFFPDATVFGAATDADFADALGGGVFMATGGRSGPLLLVDPGSSTLSTSVAQYLASLVPGTPGFVFGGPLAVPPSVVGALQSAVG